jgi:transposase
MEKRPRFTAEFKREAVRQMRESGKAVAVVARELGIARKQLYDWAGEIEKKGEDAFPGNGRLSAGNAELVALKRENARLQEEVEILKKAAAYFARALR